MEGRKSLGYRRRCGQSWEVPPGKIRALEGHAGLGGRLWEQPPVTACWMIPHPPQLMPLHHLSPQLGTVRGAESLAQLSDSAESHPSS